MTVTFDDWKELLSDENKKHLKENGIKSFNDLLNQHIHIQKFKKLYPGSHPCVQCEIIISILTKIMDGENQ